MNRNPEIMLVMALARAVYIAKINYYKGEVTISDEEYDMLEKMLERLCPKHPILTECVGDPDFNEKYLIRGAEIEAILPRKN